MTYSSVAVEIWQWRLEVASADCGQQDGCDDDRVAARRTVRTRQRFGGRFHAAMKPTVVELGDGAILRSSALQAAILRLVLSHWVGLDVPVNKQEYVSAMLKCKLYFENVHWTSKTVKRTLTVNRWMECKNVRRVKRVSTTRLNFYIEFATKVESTVNAK